jgi:hypothetical protein
MTQGDGKIIGKRKDRTIADDRGQRILDEIHQAITKNLDEMLCELGCILDYHFSQSQTILRLDHKKALEIIEKIAKENNDISLLEILTILGNRIHK